MYIFYTTKSEVIHFTDASLFENARQKPSQTHLYTGQFDTITGEIDFIYLFVLSRFDTIAQDVDCTNNE